MRKKIISGFTVFFVFLTVSCGGKYTPGKYFDIEIIRGGEAAAITGYKKDFPVVRVPPVINKIPVRVLKNLKYNGELHKGKLGNYWFPAKEVILPEGLEIIGEGALRTTQIRSIIIPSSVRGIGKNAFPADKLETIYLPEGVTCNGNVFFEIYNNNGRKAGYYLSKKNIWTYKESLD